MNEEEVGRACSMGIRETKSYKKMFIWKHKDRDCVRDLGRRKYNIETDL